MPLSDASIKAAKPTQRPQRLADERGMYMLLNPDGSRWWRFDYRINGTRKTLSFGVYPEVSLKLARERRDAARAQVAQGIDPSAKRRAEKNANADTFELVAREWFQKFSAKWADSHSEKIIGRLQANIFPWIGSRPIGQLKAPELLSVIRRLEARELLETAHRCMGYCSQIFRYAVATSRAERDITVDLRGAIPPSTPKNHAAITDPTQIGELLRAIDGYSGSFVTQSALKLAPLVFLRPGELRRGEWTEIDFEQGEWRIPAVKMKMGDAHIVPLSRQALAILTELKPLSGGGKYIFPGGHSSQRPMSENAVLAALRRMGYTNSEMTGHGFRAMARTVLDEVLGERVDLIEHQLAHALKDANGRAYNRTTHLPARRDMMQRWADYLDGLKVGG